MTNNKKCEAAAIWWAVVSGKCDKCQYYDQCSTNTKFNFPADAACVEMKRKMLKEKKQDA